MEEFGCIVIANSHMFGKLVFGSQGPVVLSIVSLTSWLRGQFVKCFTTLKPNTLMFVVEKMREASHIFSTKMCVFQILTYEILKKH